MSRQDRLDHALDQGIADLFLGDFGRVLRRNEHCVNALGLAVFIFYRDLTLAIRTQPGQRPVLTYCRKVTRQLVRQ